MAWPFVDRRERLRREASDWLAKLNGPDGAHQRAAFEQWYRADTAHAEAYERLAALFDLAAQARPEPGRAARAGTRKQWLAYPGAALAAAALAVGAVVVFAPGLGQGPRDARLTVFVAPDQASRRVVLDDGSEALLAAGSELAVAMEKRARRLNLRRGEGRFTVAHEPRPFIVSARETEVVARGTRFTVRLDPHQTRVSLIEGRIDVSYALGEGQPVRRITSLGPGESLMVPEAPDPSAERPAQPAPVAMIEFDDTPLGEAVERINRVHAGDLVHLADPALARRRITGAFRTDDPAGFARGAAAALGLQAIRRGSEGQWLLASRAGAPPG